MKLSKAQLAILREMERDAEIMWASGLHGGCRLQRGGAGRGGEARSIRIDTAHKLRRSGLIEEAGRKVGLSPVYVISAKGRAAVGR